MSVIELDTTPVMSRTGPSGNIHETDSHYPVERAELQDYMIACAILGGIVFIYKLIINHILVTFGITINPVIETLYSTTLYFLVSPVFVLIAWRIRIIENHSYLLLYLFMIFLPVMFISSFLYLYITGDGFFYFENRYLNINFLETFAVKLIRAFPLIVAAPVVFFPLARWSALRRSRFAEGKAGSEISGISGSLTETDLHTLSHESQTRHPHFIRDLLKKRWRETLWQRTAIYGSLSFLFILLLHPEYQKLDQYVVLAISLSILAASLYYLVTVFLEKTFFRQGVTDRLVLILDMIPILSWAALSVMLMASLADRMNGNMLVGKTALIEQHSMNFMLLSAIWGMSMVIPAGMTSTRLMAAYLPRLASAGITGIGIYLLVPGALWTHAALVVFFFTSMALITAYFSYIRNLQQVVAIFERDEAIERVKVEYNMRQNLVRKIGHDLRNVHYSVHLLTGRLEQRYENLSEELSLVRESIQYANDLFYDIQNANFLGRQAMYSEPARIGELLSFVTRTFEEQARTKSIQISYVDTDIHINTDITMLERIIRNVLSNTIKYSGCSRILLGVKRRTGQSLKYSEIRIADNGNGRDFISSELQASDNLMDYNSMTNRSLKLGLHIIRELCDTLGYTYRICHKPGRGTVFIITIPPEAHCC